MILASYVQQAEPAFIQLWVGAFEADAPPTALVIRVDDVNTAHEVVAAWSPIRDGKTGDGGQAANYRTVVRVAANQRGRDYRVTVCADDARFEITTNTLPSAVPHALDGTFNILLCSCYSQPDDVTGLLGSTVAQIKLRPQLTLLMGDQIYGDLPLFEDLPDDAPGVARTLGKKYRRNWLSTPRHSAGLGAVLARAPVVCVADDHEYWNNYPFEQVLLPHTRTEAGRTQWESAARALYDDYQMPGAHAGAQRIDIEPLHILVLDLRSERTRDFRQLASDATLGALEQWATDMINAKALHRTPVGVLCSGATLFVEAASEMKRVMVDAEMANFEDFESKFMPQLERLADHGIPVIYITGDVHWGRVAQGLDVRSGRTLLYEVICSPARLISVPLHDTAADVTSVIKGIFGERDPWPRHGDPQPVPDSMGAERRFRLRCDLASDEGFAQRGDQVAMISFARAGDGVDFSVTYYGISDDKALAKSRTTRTYSVRT